jgi:predicted lipoprotein with Yx(FWY)xxD motif
VFALEAQRGHVVLEVLEEELPLALAVNGGQQTPDLLAGQFALVARHEGQQVLARDGLPVRTQQTEDVGGVEVEGTQQRLVQLHQSS